MTQLSHLNGLPVSLVHVGREASNRSHHIRRCTVPLGKGSQGVTMNAAISPVSPPLVKLIPEISICNPEHEGLRKNKVTALRERHVHGGARVIVVEPLIERRADGRGFERSSGTTRRRRIATSWPLLRALALP